MTIVADFIQRLQAIDPQVFRIIGGAIDFAAIADKRPTALPAAYVFIEEEASEPSERSTGPVLQRSEADVAVVIIAGNLSDTTGSAVAGDLEGLKGLVRAQLVGFVPDEATGEVVEHVGAQLLKAMHGVVWHRELFAVPNYIEEQE